LAAGAAGGASAGAAEADTGTAGSPEAGARPEVEGGAGREGDAGRAAGWADPGGWAGAASSRRSHTLGAEDWEAVPERGVNAGDGRWKAAGRDAGGTTGSEERGDPAAGGSAGRVPGACAAGWGRGTSGWGRGTSGWDWAAAGWTLGASGWDWAAADWIRGKVPAGGTALSQSAASVARPEGALPGTGSAGLLCPAALVAAGWALAGRAAAGSQSGSAGSQTGLAADGRE
jgi:hypothetical protein